MQVRVPCHTNCVQTHGTSGPARPLSLLPLSYFLLPRYFLGTFRYHSSFPSLDPSPSSSLTMDHGVGPQEPPPPIRRDPNALSVGRSQNVKQSKRNNANPCHPPSTILPILTSYTDGPTIIHFPISWYLPACQSTVPSYHHHLVVRRQAGRQAGRHSDPAKILS